MLSGLQTTEKAKVFKFYLLLFAFTAEKAPQESETQDELKLSRTRHRVGKDLQKSVPLVLL